MKYTILLVITFSCFFIKGQISHDLQWQDLNSSIQFAFSEEDSSKQNEETHVNYNKLIRQSIKDITEIKEFIDWDKRNGDITGWVADSYQLMLDDLLDNLKMIKNHKKHTFKN